MKPLLKSAMALLVAVALLTLARLGWQSLPGVSEPGPLTLAASSLAAEEKLKAGMVDPATGKKIKYWVAPMDPTYIRDEPGKSPMGMDLVPIYEDKGGEKEPLSTIRIDPVTVQNMGIRTARISRQAAVKTIRTVGTMTFDETRIFAVNTKFNGWIERLYVSFEGQRVKRGQPLFDIYSPELVTAQEEYLLALEQVRSLGESDFTQVREAARRLQAASRKRLRYWDVSEAQIRHIEKTGQVSKTVTVYAPSGGVVTKKNAFLGHYVKAGEHQYEIADLSQVWVDVDIYEYELPWVRQGMRAEMELAYIPSERFRGEVLFIYPYLKPETRTARLRLTFANPHGQLKPDMYANIFLESKLGEDVLVVPQEAVIDSGVRKMVFVSRGEGKFEPREVKLGLEVNQNQFQVTEGLSVGEEIVLSAQFMLDSESRLREAIQKMLEVKRGGGQAAADELDISGPTMDDDDLDMGGLSMDEPAPSASPKP